MTEKRRVQRVMPSQLPMRFITLFSSLMAFVLSLGRNVFVFDRRKMNCVFASLWDSLKDWWSSLVMEAGGEIMNRDERNEPSRSTRLPTLLHNESSFSLPLLILLIPNALLFFSGPATPMRTYRSSFESMRGEALLVNWSSCRGWLSSCCASRSFIL